MRHIYIDSQLTPLTVAARVHPKRWIFSQGKPWLLLTPDRLSRLAFRLGLRDWRIECLVDNVRRHSQRPGDFCTPLGLEVEPYYEEGNYPPALCPVCDRVHHPHPLDVNQPCLCCREKERVQDSRSETPGVLRDRRENGEARERLFQENPSLFCEGELSPNWQMNYTRRLHRDWDAAVNRILMGGAYRAVARDFNCSVGLLHKKVQERKYWEDN